MSVYRKKPVEIEAFRMGMDARPDWFQDKVTTNEIITFSMEPSNNPFDFVPTYCEINTLEGTMRGDYGDYIIKGVNGEIYPCKTEIFAKTYDFVR